jgi:hypothetical protein
MAFLNWVRLVILVFLTSMTLDPTRGMKNVVRRLDSRKRIWLMGAMVRNLETATRRTSHLASGGFSMATSQTGRFFYWGGAAVPPYRMR